MFQIGIALSSSFRGCCRRRCRLGGRDVVIRREDAQPEFGAGGGVGQIGGREFQVGGNWGTVIRDW